MFAPYPTHINKVHYGTKATGLFLKVEETPEPTPEQVEAHRQLREAALEHSRKSMSPIIARYL